MFDQFNDDVAKTVLWLVNRVKDYSSKPDPDMNNEQKLCRLNDFSSYETPYIVQAMESEDRI